MPTAYLKKVADERGVALKKLEEYWNKAKDLAKKNKDPQGEDYWKYVMGIFKNVASLNGVSVSAAYESISKRVSNLKKPAKPKKPVKPARKKPNYPVKKKASTTKTKAKPKAKAKTTRKSKAVKLPEWWVKKTELGKKKYIEQHPASKYSKEGAKGNPALEKTLKAAQKKAGIKPSPTSNLERDPKKVNDQIKKMKPPEGSKSPVSVKQANKDSTGPAPKPIINNPIPAPKVMPAGGPSKQDQDAELDTNQRTQAVRHKSIFHKAYYHARKKINHALKANRVGMKAVGKFLKGGNLNDKEKLMAKSWAGMAAKLVVGVAVGAALFTPLAGMAPELGEHFLNLLSGNNSESSDRSESAGHKSETKGKIVPLGDADSFEPTDFTDRLEDWLQTQDIPALVKKLQEGK